MSVVNHGFKPKCIWCSAEWSDDNVEIEAYGGGMGCETCGYGSEIEVTVSITSHVCDKEMYRKEGH